MNETREKKKSPNFTRSQYTCVAILGTGTNLTFLMRLVGKKKTKAQPTKAHPKKLNLCPCAVYLLHAVTTAPH